ncbi:MAG: formate acetyltransferase [Chloroflexi bacterium]|nr:formate acetyltransferase [Chloroflexota bacterium]
MIGISEAQELTYDQRIDALRATKMRITQEKQQIIGSMNHDDWGLILPPADRREIVQTMSASGMPITDALIAGFQVQSNHPSGGFFGPKAVGANYRALLEQHPVYIDPVSSLAGGYMANFMSYRKPHWNPDLDFSFLHADQQKYGLGSGIGAAQHFCHDLTIGFQLGWGGLLNKIRRYREVQQSTVTDQALLAQKLDFYDGLESIVLGMQNWIQRTADEARAMNKSESNPQRRENLEALADINTRLVTEPPKTFREACQWMNWYQMAARMFNGNGALGRLDVLLQPYYERDSALGILDDEEAIFHLACFLVRNTDYIQLGGPDENGKDTTTRLSFLALEAAHRLKIPANIGVCVGDEVDPDLLRRGVEIMFEDKCATPKFLGIDRTTEGFMRNGYTSEVARTRAYSGCHWSAIPGREYTLNDCVKINFGKVFEAALQEMMSDASLQPSTETLFTLYARHLRRAVATIAQGLDYHMEHYHQVFPELFLDLLCYGTIEKGLDASHGGVEYYNLCVDGSALATVTDSFAALEQRIDRQKRMTWHEIVRHLDENWAGADGEKARLMMKSIPRYGSGGSRADEWAVRLSDLFTKIVKEKPTPNGFNMIPGLFSWANTIPMGKELGATPNGRRAGEPISHGANPDPGYRKDGAPTAMAVAIATVQPGYGNTAPMQMELDPGITKDEGGVDHIVDLIKTHFDLGGTQINLNIMDAEQVLEAHKDPSKYPDLVVRVTGFSAYFASLSPDFRQLVVDRILTEG